jgi:membrane fusion protein, adhesin transport system
MAQTPNSQSTYSANAEHLRELQELRTPRAGRRLARWVVGITIGLFLCLFLPWQQNINGSGTTTALRPQDRPQTIQTVIAGRIERWVHQEGDRVKRGDTILVLSEVKDEYFDPKIIERFTEQVAAKEAAIVAYKTKVEALTHQIAALTEGRGLSIQKAQNKLKQARLKVRADSADVLAATLDRRIADQQLERLEALYAKGLFPLTELEKRRLKRQETESKLISGQAKLLVSRNELLNAKIEISSIGAEYADKLAKADSDRSSAQSALADGDSELSKLRNKLSSIRVRQQNYVLRAPQNGIVVRALRVGVGETIKEGESVATIMPTGAELIATVFVRPVDLPLVQPGTPVRLEFDGWPALQFSGWPGASIGTFGGRVQVVDYVADQTSGKYRLLVIPDPNDDPWPPQLRPGSGVNGWAMLKTVPVWYELWRQINAFPADLPDPSDKGKGNKSSTEGGKDAKK